MWAHEFIHTSVNSYDLHLLNTKPKRIYSYNPYDAYVNLKVSEMNKDHVDKIFSKYRLDNNGEIINEESFEGNGYLIIHLRMTGYFALTNNSSKPCKHKKNE